MILPIPLISAIETAMNAWLKLDGEILHRLSELEGEIIQFHITGLELNLYFLPSHSGFQVLGQYPDEKDGGIVDVCIHGSLPAFIKLSTSKDAGATMLKTDVEVDGDMRVAEKFSKILREIDIDWEEYLSKFTGDIFAHQAGETSRNIKSWLVDNAQAMTLNVGEYISEESNLSPSETDIDSFLSDVDEIKISVSRLEARIKLLSKQFQIDN